MYIPKVAAVAVTYSLGLALYQVEDFIAGLIYGLIEHDDLAAIKTCMTGSEKLENDISEAFINLMKGDI